MAVTYTTTDSTGLVHTRKSARHVSPQYPYAVVRKPGDPAKRYVSYHGTRSRAVSELNACRAYHPKAELLETSASS